MLLSLFMSPALAGACDAHLATLEKAPKEQISAHFATLVACSSKEAERNFKAYVRASGDVPTLVDLSLKAIELEQYQSVWDMLEQLTDYSARQEVAKRVGALCQDNVGVLPFLQGGYFAANDRAFGMWSDAFETCSSEGLTDWMQSKVVDPPARTYDEKYNHLLNAWVGRKGKDGLRVLEKAAVVASERGGPFTGILEKMTEALRPGRVGSASDEQKKELAAAYERVGTGGVRPEQAALVADRLYQMGFQEKAAGLLKVVYGDRVQAGGQLLYGVASVEHCGGEAVVHIASVYEPARRWSIIESVGEPAKAFKQRLKCDTTDGWSVYVTNSPVATVAEVAAHGETIAKKYADKNLAVKLREEKPFTLP